MPAKPGTCPTCGKRAGGRPTEYTAEQDAQLLASAAHGLSDLSERWGKSVLALLSRRNKLRAKARRAA
jgi:hypothetical protein